MFYAGDFGFIAVQCSWCSSQYAFEEINRMHVFFAIVVHTYQHNNVGFYSITFPIWPLDSKLNNIGVAVFFIFFNPL